MQIKRNYDIGCGKYTNGVFPMYKKVNPDNKM